MTEIVFPKGTSAEQKERTLRTHLAQEANARVAEVTPHDPPCHQCGGSVRHHSFMGGGGRGTMTCDCAVCVARPPDERCSLFRFPRA